MALGAKVYEELNKASAEAANNESQENKDDKKDNVVDAQYEEK